MKRSAHQPDVLILSRNDAAKKVIDRLDKILQTSSGFQALCFRLNATPQKITYGLNAFFKKRRSKKPLLIFVDLEGTTLANIGHRFVQKDKTIMIAGYNLPMLIKLASLNQPHELNELARFLIEYGKNHIHVIG